MKSLLTNVAILVGSEARAQQPIRVPFCVSRLRFLEPTHECMMTERWYVLVCKAARAFDGLTEARAVWPSWFKLFLVRSIGHDWLGTPLHRQAGGMCQNARCLLVRVATGPMFRVEPDARQLLFRRTLDTFPVISGNLMSSPRRVQGRWATT